MIIYSIIQKSKLEGALRLDAEYYQPEYFIDFSKGEWVPISSILKICQYGISQAMNKEGIGQPIFKMDDIKNAFLVDDKVKYANIVPQIFKQFKLRKNDVLFNRVNSEEFVGRTGIFKLDGDFVFASYLIRLQVKEGANIFSDYLNIFLNSKFGIKQIKKYRRRAVNQANVNAEELKQFKIPVLSMGFQREIEKLSNESWQNFKNSKSLYSKAENLLLEELELKDFKIEDEIYNIVNLSDTKEANRLDADFFQSKHKKLIQKVVEKFDVQDLKQVFNFKRGIFIPTESYTDQKTNMPYIRIKELSGGKAGIDKSKVIFINDEYRNDKNNTLKENDLVIAIIGDTIGKTNRINKELEGGFCSNNMGRLRIKSEFFSKIISEFSEVLFQSSFIQSQIGQKKTQTGQPKIGDNEIKSLKIPIISKFTQQKIADLVQKSHKARSKAKELLQQAKQEVEEEIEKNE